MRADSAIRIRVSDELKSEMQTRARADGISLSHALRTAGRLGLLLGPGRLHQAVATVSAMRRDLHAATADLHQIAADAAAVVGRLDDGRSGLVGDGRYCRCGTSDARRARAVTRNC